MNICLEGKVALVTGAGIGFATAQAFAQAGAAVALADINAAAVRAATEKLLAAGYKALAICCNVAEKSAVATMVDQTVSTFGRLDAAFNNAGVNSGGADLLETSDDEFDRIVSVNLRDVWNCMKAEIRQMKAQGGGAIVNCSSIGGMVADQCRLSGNYQYADGHSSCQKQRSRHREGHDRAGANRTFRRA